MGRQLGFEKIKNSKGKKIFEDFKDRKDHGGILRPGQRKLCRPLEVRRPVHLILRASQARGGMVFYET